MAKQLRTKTIYDFAIILELQKVVGKVIAPRESWKRRGPLILGGATAIVYGLIRAYGGDLTSLLWLGGMGSIAVLWGLMLFRIRARKALRAMQGNTLVEFVFEKENVLVFQSGKSNRYAYADTQLLLETDRCIYMILKNGQGMQMDKENVQGGTADELRALLESKSGKPVQRVQRL